MNKSSLLKKTLFLCAGVVTVAALAWGYRSYSAAPSAVQIVDEMEAAAGRIHPGFRRNHAKGLCVSGRFESSGNGVQVSKASIFKPGVTPVIGRFSAAGPDPAQADVRGMIRSLALSLYTADGQAWYTAMNSVPVFPVNTPQGLYDELRASVPEYGGSGPDPQKMQAFRRAHPEIERFDAWLAEHPGASGFDNTAYYSVNAFRMIDAGGTVRFVRWNLVPDTPYAPMSDMQREDPDFLAFGFASRMEQSAVRWHLLITLAEPGDPTTDATLLWPDTRRQIDAGVLVIDRQQSQVDGPCRDVDFNPLQLPPGIEASDDPLLLARGPRMPSRTGGASTSKRHRTDDFSFFSRPPE
ncbi:MAG: Catalase-related peroxidase [Pseudomonas sp.]|nr:MAG: Catalase-related peroxidase [Pseudomonas sp.]